MPPRKMNQGKSFLKKPQNILLNVDFFALMQSVDLNNADNAMHLLIIWVSHAVRINNLNYRKNVGIVNNP